MTNLIQKFTAAVIILTVVLFSCKKDKDSGNVPSTSNLLTEFSNGDEFIRFSYNPDNSVATVMLKDEENTNGAAVIYAVSYLADKKIDEFKSANSRIKLEYENGTLKKAVRFESNKKVAETDYHFVNGFLKSTTISIAESDILIPAIKFINYYDNAGNVGKISTWLYNPLTDQLEPAGYTEREHDNKANPFVSVSDIMMVLWQVPGKNNLTKETQYDNDGQMQEVTDYTYTYNSKSYPLAATVKTTTPGENPVNSNIIFKYK